MKTKNISEFETKLRNTSSNTSINIFADDVVDLLDDKNKTIEKLYNLLLSATGRYNLDVSQVNDISNTLQSLDGKKRKIVESSLHDMKLYLQEISGE